MPSRFAALAVSSYEQPKAYALEAPESASLWHGAGTHPQVLTEAQKIENARYSRAVHEAVKEHAARSDRQVMVDLLKRRIPEHETSFEQREVDLGDGTTGIVAIAEIDEAKEAAIFEFLTRRLPFLQMLARMCDVPGVAEVIGANIGRQTALMHQVNKLQALLEDAKRDPAKADTKGINNTINGITTNLEKLKTSGVANLPINKIIQGIAQLSEMQKLLKVAAPALQSKNELTASSFAARAGMAAGPRMTGGYNTLSNFASRATASVTSTAASVVSSVSSMARQGAVAASIAIASVAPATPALSASPSAVSASPAVTALAPAPAPAPAATSNTNSAPVAQAPATPVATTQTAEAPRAEAVQQSAPQQAQPVAQQNNDQPQQQPQAQQQQVQQQAEQKQETKAPETVETKPAQQEAKAEVPEAKAEEQKPTFQAQEPEKRVEQVAEVKNPETRPAEPETKPAEVKFEAPKEVITEPVKEGAPAEIFSNPTGGGREIFSADSRQPPAIDTKAPEKAGLFGTDEKRPTEVTTSGLFGPEKTSQVLNLFGKGDPNAAKLTNMAMLNGQRCAECTGGCPGCPMSKLANISDAQKGEMQATAQAKLSALMNPGMR